MEPSEALRQAIEGSRVASMAEGNELAKYHSDFHIQSFDGHRLVLVGSFDLCYYHDIELHFVGVGRIDCPVWFHSPQFVDEGLIQDPGSSISEPRRYVIQCDEGRYAVMARNIEIVLGTVFYYDRGDELKPGERIAQWVKRGEP
ncbi:MAG: hypothetical protein C0467_24320 [Planctomycetaceae bacterium]|nr:hypothetical protein [Planctomycetaceae bacterium]